MPRLPSNLPPAGSKDKTALVGWWDIGRALPCRKTVVAAQIQERRCV
jgi:hypothetical protein